MSYLSLVVYINEEDYSTLLSEGEIEINGETYEYDDSALYIIKDVPIPEYADTARYATTAGSARVADTAIGDANGNNIIQTYGKKPLVIEVNEGDLPKNLPSGTYNSVTLALSNNREVVVKLTRDTADDEVTYCRFSEDWSDPENTYYFYNSSIGLGIVLGTNNIISNISWHSPNYHSHGNINQYGRLSTTTTISNADKLVITDADASNRIKASSISFDGSTTSKALTQKGTWENVVNSVNGQSGAVTLGTAASLNAGSANGVATLDSGGKVPANQLPSYVDDIIEGYYNNGNFYSTYSNSTYSDLITGETGKIYVDLGNGNKSYRWSGSAYVEIVASPGSTDNIVEGSTNLWNKLADWNQTSTTAGDYIKNKPTIPTHWANVTVGTSANYITEPEFKSVKINGSTTNAASSDNCYLLYDTTNKCLKFIFN